MTKPPPEDLMKWPKGHLCREVERLRAVLREHAERRHDEAPDTAGGLVDVAGDPYARGGVVIDSRGAVLLDAVDVTLLDTKGPDGLSLGLQLAGRINYEERRSSILYLMPTDGAAAIISQLMGLGQRAGGEFLAELATRLDQLP